MEDPSKEQTVAPKAQPKAKAKADLCRVKASILMFRQSSTSQRAAQAGAGENDDDFDFVKSICADADRTIAWLQMNHFQLKNEYKKFKAHRDKAEEEVFERKTRSKKDSLKDSYHDEVLNPTCQDTYAEDNFTEPSHPLPMDDFYYTNSALDQSLKGDRPSEAAAPFKEKKLRRPHVENETETVVRTRDPCPTNSDTCRRHLRGRKDEFTHEEKVRLNGYMLATRLSDSIGSS